MGRPINNIRKVRTVIKINKQGAGKLITLGNSVILRMTGNLYFTTPAPTLASVQTAVSDLSNAWRHQNIKRARGSKADTQDFNAKLNVVRVLLTALQQYVINQALIQAGNNNLQYAQIVGTSGFGIIPANSRNSVTQIPTYVSQSNNKLHPGTSGRLKWKRPIGLIKGASTSGYNIYTKDINNNWVISKTTTKTNTVIPTAPGTNVDVKIVPFNSRGEGQAFFATVKGL